jgi:hypothetical protein
MRESLEAKFRMHTCQMAFTNTAAAPKASALKIPIWSKNFTPNSGSQDQYLSHRTTFATFHREQPPA